MRVLNVPSKCKIHSEIETSLKGKVEVGGSSSLGQCPCTKPKYSFGTYFRLRKRHQGPLVR